LVSKMIAEICSGGYFFDQQNSTRWVLFSISKTPCATPTIICQPSAQVKHWGEAGFHAILFRANLPN
jgi:hypothetical protein